jgi:hypothetical protein
MAFEELMKELPDINVCINSPKKAPIPSRADITFALILALSFKTTYQNFTSIMEYIDRMKSEFKVLWASTIMKKAASNSDFGKIIARKELMDFFERNKISDMVIGSF